MRWIVAALLACLGGSALAQTLPLPTYRGVILSPQSGTPGGVVNGQCWTQSTGLFCYVAGGVVGPFATGAGFVSTTGTPASGNLSKFSGAASITNGDLTGDVTTSGTLASTLAAGSASVLNSGTLPAGRMPALTGDVTASAGSTTTTLAAGNASVLNAGTLLAARMPALTGDVTTSAGAVATTLATVNSNTGAWGDATHVGQITVNAKGLVTAAASVAIAGIAPSGSAGGDLSGTYPNPAVAKINGATLGLTTATSGNLLIGSGSSWVTQALTGDVAITLGGVTVVSKLNGVAYGTSPSTNTVPVVTSANTVTYEAVPNAALANSSITIGGQAISLGGSTTNQGTGGKLQLSTGTTTTSHCVQFDVNGNTVDAGFACGSGSGSVGTTGSPASGNLTTFSGASTITNSDLTGDLTTSGTVATTLATVNANTGSWGDGTHVGAFTVNGKGLITAASSVAITGAAPTGSAGGDLTGTYPNPTLGSGSASVLNSGTLLAARMPALTGDITTSAGSVATTLAAGSATNLNSGTLAAARGGAGAINGALKGNGSGVVSQAACSDLSNGATGCSTATGTSGATIPLLNAANTWGNSQAGSVTTLAISTATFTPDASNNHYKITLTAACPCTIANPSPAFVAGTSGTIQVIQSAVGSVTVGTWGSSYIAPGGTSTIVLSTAANAIDVLSYFVQDSTHIMLVPSYNFSH